ncbi:hypothetical protein BDP27DRAFT_838669 [Rhodocollybia butyracea]|uniref:Uncharacterized protein n=1 Tax=Rhodocollybia butyracea TaxID=206335 RepID=A0A9P5PU37_9AGAR|nr:hypothetical protein BDP27DRAFT_838669 [Rhodocollybia butyracea]
MGMRMLTIPVSIFAANARRPTLNTATSKSTFSTIALESFSTHNPNHSIRPLSSPLAMDSTKLSSDNGPRFVYTLGANMRITTRLSKDVWWYSEPLGGRGLCEMNLFALLKSRCLRALTHPHHPHALRPR